MVGLYTIKDCTMEQPDGNECQPLTDSYVGAQSSVAIQLENQNELDCAIAGQPVVSLVSLMFRAATLKSKQWNTHRKLVSKMVPSAAFAESDTCLRNPGLKPTPLVVFTLLSASSGASTFF